MLWLDWWLLAFWVVVLAGLVGGKVYQQDARWQRRVYLVVLVYLLALLAVAILPEIAPRREIDVEIRAYAEFLLPLAFVVIALMPAEPDAGDAPHIIDFFYSLFLMLLLVVIILGSFTFMTLRRTPYLEALTYTVFLTAGAVLLVALAWNPRSGGVGVFFARYLFSIGLPVEKWLHLLAELLPDRGAPGALSSRSARRAAAPALGRRACNGAPARKASRRAASSAAAPRTRSSTRPTELGLTIYSRYRLGPALRWHLHLLGQLLGEFYAAKLREEKLRQASYLQAVYETGARMTHDIKNLLQSLSVLTSVAREDEATAIRRNCRRCCAGSSRSSSGGLPTRSRSFSARRRLARRTSRAHLVGRRSRASIAPRASSSSRQRLLRRPAAALAFRHRGG